MRKINFLIPLHVFLLAFLVVPTIAMAHSFKPGDELWTQRKLGTINYHHAGVYIGNNQVVHVTATAGSALKRFTQGQTIVTVKKTSLSAFAEGKSVRRGPAKPRFPREKVVKRALARVGNSYSYHPLNRNCQHFSSKIITGSASSPEAHLFVKAASKSNSKIAKKAAKVVSKAAHKAANVAKKVAKKAEKFIRKYGVKIRRKPKKRKKKAKKGKKKA